MSNYENNGRMLNAQEQMIVETIVLMGFASVGDVKHLCQTDRETAVRMLQELEAANYLVEMIDGTYEWTGMLPPNRLPEHEVERRVKETILSLEREKERQENILNAQFGFPVSHKFAMMTVDQIRLLPRGPSNDGPVEFDANG